MIAIEIEDGVATIISMALPLNPGLLLELGWQQDDSFTWQTHDLRVVDATVKHPFFWLAQVQCLYWSGYED